MPQPAPRDDAARGYDERHVRPGKRHVGEPLLLARHGASYRFAVYGTKGRAELSAQDLDFHFTPVPDAMPAGRHTAPPPEIIEYKGFNTLAAELEGFAAAINGERPYPITADEVLHGVAAFEAIVRSAAAHAGQGRALGRGPAMPVTVLYPEDRQIPDDISKREIFGPEVRMKRGARRCPSSTPPTAPRSTG